MGCKVNYVFMNTIYDEKAETFVEGSKVLDRDQLAERLKPYVDGNFVLEKYKVKEGVTGEPETLQIDSLQLVGAGGDYMIGYRERMGKDLETRFLTDEHYRLRDEGEGVVTFTVKQKGVSFEMWRVGPAEK